MAPKAPAPLAAAAALAVLAAAAPAHAVKVAPNAPPQLWSIEPQAAAAKIIHICADAAIQAGFAHGLPEVDGKPCVVVGRRPVVKGELFAARCRIDRTLFTAHSVSTGDPKTDFVVDTTIQTEAAPDKRFESKIRYRKVAAACPAGWAIGDSGAVGSTTLKNAYSGATRELPKPIPAS